MMQDDNQEVDIDEVLARYDRPKTRRGNWENLWQECYDMALPGRGEFHAVHSGAAQHSQIYDGTALDATDQLAASMLGQLTPPWTQWFGLKPGPELDEGQAAALGPVLEKAAKTIQSHLDRSNFSVEMHQCFLDLVVGGTASLVVEEQTPGGLSAFNFTASPLRDIALEEGENGILDGTFRELSLTLNQIQARYPFAELPSSIVKQGDRDPQQKFDVIESVLPEEEVRGYAFIAVLKSEQEETVLKQLRLPHSPVINFRWQKSPGEMYGRSPVMKALPDIKTANKVVELTLKNASISVSGIWQADDDGVLNPANIELTPGTIIPKAVGSQGLSPLDMPGRFDVSQLVLEDLRARIRHALLADKLAPVQSPRMTATEVLERAGDMAQLLGATYGRLQSELLTPLITRTYEILRARGEVPDVLLDGRRVTIDFRSPLARSQGQQSVQNTLSWINTVLNMGGEAAMAVDLPAAARYLGEALGVPQDLMRNRQALNAYIAQNEDNNANQPQGESS